MGRQLVLGLAVVVIAVDRMVDCSQGPQNGGYHLGRLFSRASKWWLPFGYIVYPYGNHPKRDP
eukprot:753805-Rhodomonas_salina.1